MTDRGTEPRPAFSGSELPRLLILAAIMVVGWGLVWRFANQRPQPAEPDRQGRAEARARRLPTAPNEFETVTDRTPMSFRDNAAYAYLLEKARKQTPAELAAQSRRDVLLTHIWERPSCTAACPSTFWARPGGCSAIESKLSKTGWLYEAWIITPDATQVSVSVASSRRPRGFPSAPTCPSAWCSTATS